MSMMKHRKSIILPPLCSMNHTPATDDGFVDVPDPVVASVADVQVPVPEGGRPWSRGGPCRCHGDAAIHAVEDRDVLDRGPASRAHACFREEAVHDPRAEGLLVVPGDLDPCDLGHVCARLTERGGRAHDPVPGENDVRPERRLPGTRWRNPGRMRDQYPRQDGLDDQCPIKILGSHISASHPGAEAPQCFHRPGLIPRRTWEAVAQEKRWGICHCNHEYPYASWGR